MRWTVLSRVKLYGVMLVVTAAPLAFYGLVAIGKPLSYSWLVARLLIRQAVAPESR